MKYRYIFIFYHAIILYILFSLKKAFDNNYFENFSLIEFLKKNSAYSEHTISLLSFYCLLISSIITFIIIICLIRISLFIHIIHICVTFILKNLFTSSQGQKNCFIEKCIMNFFYGMFYISFILYILTGLSIFILFCTYHAVKSIST